MSDKKTIFVIGAGKGCGNHVAKRFGKEGFEVVLMSRSAEHLQEYAEEFKADGVEVHTRVLDVRDLDSVTEVLGDLKAEFGVPDVLFYNVGITGADTSLQPGEKNAGLLCDRYLVDVAAAYHCIQQIMCEEFQQKKGAILVTGGGLALNPMDLFLPLSMDKAALRAMCIALHDAYAPKGVYVGTVTVTDVIEPGAKCDPSLLAGDFWDLYSNRKVCEIVR